MRSTRILAGLSAAAFAASMMSMVSASAAEEVAGTGACTVVVGDDYKGEEDITLDLLDDVDPADVVAIHFTAQEEGKEFQVAFNGKEVTDHDEATGEDSYVTVTDPDTDITIDADDVNWDNLYFSVRYTSETVGDEVTVDWEVLVDGEVTDSTDPEDSSSEVERRGAVELEINQGISYNDNFAFTHENAIEEGGNHNYVGIGLKLSPRLDTTQAAYWTGDCSFVMITTYDNGSVYCRAIAGRNYDGSDMELSAERFEELDEDVIIDSADIHVLGGENDEWDMSTSFAFDDVEKVSIYAMDWSETEESANTPYINVDKINLTYIDTGAPEESSSSESSSETPSSSEASSSVASSSEASSSSSSTVDNNSSSSTASSSSTGSSSAAGGNNSGGAANGDNNPSTGAAALGALGVVLAGAAMVVSKKND